MSNSETSVADLGFTPSAVATTASSFFPRPIAWALCLTLLLGIGIFRIVSTYHVFNHTIDEPSHLACGMEWWEKGVYRIETKHAPLARISIAFLPYLSGLRAPAEFKTWVDTYPILSADGHYWRNLTLARIGVLPFFIIATLVVFFWTKRLYGPAAGLLAAAIFTMEPTILAHSGLATTDIPLTAMFCWSLYAFTLWLRQPDWKTATLFGVSSGLSLATKFSTVVFLPTCGAAIIVLYLASGQRNWRPLLRTLALVVLCAFLTTWSVYRFSHGYLGQITGVPDRVAARVFGPSSGMTGVVHKVAASLPIPAPEILDGIRFLRHQNEEGARSYLFGRTSETGFWYFFIASLAVKTPLAVLLLAAIGSGVLLARYLRDRSGWEGMVPLASAVVIIIVTAPSRLNMGVRYVMPMFVFLSMLAARGLVALWRRRDHQVLCRAVAVLLFAWLAISSAWAHPDYLAYFNEFGGSDPSRLLVISDFDWGQDLSRLATYLREHHIEHISIAYDGFFDPDSLGLPKTDLLPCRAPEPSGWVVFAARRARRSPECWPWLPQQQRVAVVGKTMWIYHLPEQR